MSSSATAPPGGPTADFIAARVLQLAALLEELTQLHGDGAEAAAAVTLDQSKVGRLSRMDAMQQQAMSVAAQQRRERTSVDIRAAQQRIADGVYGECLECGEWISPARLEHTPHVRLCIGCATAAEAP